MPRQRVDTGGAARESRSRERDGDGAEGHDQDPRVGRVLPQLVPAKLCPPPRERDGFPSGGKPHWMAPAGGVSTRQPGGHQRQNGAKRHRKADPRALSLLDEQMLVLCRSAMQHSWGAAVALEEPHALPHEPSREPPEPAKTASYGHESIYAAIQVQRLFRGFKTRRRLAQFDGPRFQRAAGHIQFALRRVLVAKRAFKRWMGKRHRCATRIQAWYRGCHVRDQVQYERARVLVERVVMFQRRFRGYRFWNIVAALLAQRRNKAAMQVQRCCRGMLDRRRVRKLRQERIRFANDLKSRSDEHRRQSRCKGCHPESWTEDSLFGCFMARFIGLHDFNGAKTLGLEGVQSFPTSARFSFMVSILLQAMGEDLEISLAFLRRAETVCRLTDVHVFEVERRYLFPALQLCKNDIAVLVDLAIISQSTGKLTRAESFYRSALEQKPLDYSVPGYLHRVDMLDRLLLNYHRFCSIFNSRQVNVLAKVIPIAKRGEQVRVMVSRLNQFVRIQCAEDETVHRFNAVYLSEKEVHLLLATKDKADDDDDDAGSSRSLHPATTNLVKMNYSRHASTRRISRMAREDKSAASKVDENAARKRSLTQIYQDEFIGLALKPITISRSSEARSKLQLTREQAERLLRELLFIDPYVDMKVEISDFDGTTSTGSVASLHRVLLVPSVMRHRMIRVEEVLRSHGALNIQRVFRGFQVQARMRREKLLQTLRQQQVDQLYARLHQNFQFREKRRRAATAIQRIYKGFATRRLMARWQKAATNIQRMLRGYRGRKRAVAFREGNLTFYMAERVFNRGVSVSGKSIMLIIDRCGLSFRLEAYDMVRCTTYPGFITHDSTMALLRYENWSYAQRLVGQDVWLHGSHGVIAAVASINQADGQCTVECRFESNDHGHRLVDLTDCIQAINLRNLATKGLDAEQLLLPLSTEDTGRIVSSIVGRLALVPVIPMATKELRKKAPGSLVLTVMAPPKVHYIFNKTGAAAIEVSQTSTKARANVSFSLTRQVAFPVIDGYRGVSIGKRQFRQKCSRHSVHFTKCRCVLPLTTTPAYIQTIMLALTPPPPPSYLLTSLPDSQPTPDGPL